MIDISQRRYQELLEYEKECLLYRAAIQRMTLRVMQDTSLSEGALAWADAFMEAYDEEEERWNSQT